MTTERKRLLEDLVEDGVMKRAPLLRGEC